MVLNDFNHDEFTKNIIITNWNSSYLWFTHPGVTTPLFYSFDYNVLFASRPGDSLYVIHCDKQYQNCLYYTPQEWQELGDYDQNSLFGLDPLLNQSTW
jgi:hypothetical protein